MTDKDNPMTEEDRMIDQQIEDEQIRKAEEAEEERMIDQQIEDEQIRKAEEAEEDGMN